MKFPTKLVAAVALLVIATSIHSISAAAQSGNEKKKQDEFEGKIVTVYLHDADAHQGAVLTDVELIELGGRIMLVGTGADTGQENNWTAGTRVGLAWDKVQ